MGAISPEAIFSLVNANMNGDEYVSCVKCGFAGCDVRLSGCGCTLHAVSSTDTSDQDVFSTNYSL